jgi:acetyl-CoA carboxylase carboxyltransferase component
MTKELNAWEAALRLEIARATGSTPEVEVPEKPKKAKRKKFERHVVLGISKDRGHTITEFPHDSKQLMESLAEMDARKAAKAEGLTVYSVISNTLIK